MRLSLTSRALLLAAPLAPLAAVPAGRVLEDFDRSAPGALPDGWVYITGQGEVRGPDYVDDADRRFRVVQDGAGNRVLRMTTRGRPHRLTLLVNQTHAPRWDLSEDATLSWRWRARALPPGAREDQRRLNDVGAAVYVTFGRDLIGRPKQIKYTYSSTLPVGTTMRQGALRVMVVSTGAEPTGQWLTVSRDVRADYAALFGNLPRDPVGITVWSDTDDTNSSADMDLDDLTTGS